MWAPPGPVCGTDLDVYIMVETGRRMLLWNKGWASLAAWPASTAARSSSLQSARVLLALTTARVPPPQCRCQGAGRQINIKRRPLVSQSKVVLAGADHASKGKGAVVCPTCYSVLGNQFPLSCIFAVKAPNKSDWPFAECWFIASAFKTTFPFYFSHIDFSPFSGMP